MYVLYVLWDVVGGWVGGWVGGLERLLDYVCFITHPPTHPPTHLPTSQKMLLYHSTSHPSHPATHPPTHLFQQTLDLNRLEEPAPHVVSLLPDRRQLDAFLLSVGGWVGGWMER